MEFTSRSSSAEVHLFIIESLSSASSVHFDSVTNTKTVATIIHKVLSVALTCTKTHTGCCRVGMPHRPGFNMITFNVVCLHYQLLICCVTVIKAYYTSQVIGW